MADKTGTVIGKDQVPILVKYVDSADGTWKRRIRAIAGGAGSDKYGTVVGINQDPITVRYVDQLDGTYAERIDLIGAAGTGDLLFTPDATYDIGKSGATRPRDIFLSRNLTVGGQVLASSGNAALPGYAFSGATGTGLARVSGDEFYFSINGTAKLRITALGGVIMNSGTNFGWCDNTAANAGSVDLTLFRDAANTLAQRNGTAAQVLRIYNTFTDASNYERGKLEWAGNIFTIGTEKLGSGSARSVQVIGDSVIFSSGAGSNRWIIDSSGNFITAADNTVDIGASGATRPRSIYVGTQFLGVIGSAGTPSYSFAADPDTGIFSTADQLKFATGGTQRAFIDSGNGGRICCYQLAFDPSSSDVLLQRDAANVLALRNGVNAQAFRLYNTYTDASNWERFNFEWFSNRAKLLTDALGTGTPRPLAIGTQGAASLFITTTGSDRWEINGSGHILGVTDNSYDVGDATHRPRNIYVGNNELIGVAAVGTSGAKVLGIGTGTEPSTSPADMVQLYSVDISAGNASLGLRTETAVATDAALVSTNSLTVRINGANYKIPLVSA